jgi:uncharacterized protein
VTNTAAPADGGMRRSWGWLALLWVVLAEAVRNRVDDLLDRLPPTAVHPWHDLVIAASWATPLVIIDGAVYLIRQPVGAYLAWVRPRRFSDVLLGILVVLAPVALYRGLAYYLTGSAHYPVEEYHAARAAGTSAWWYVLQWYPAFIYAPFVEETTYRGFLWRGLERTFLRGPGTWLVTSFAFAAVHYRYYFQDGTFLLPAFLSPLIIGLILGWVRWRSGSTFASMIAHSVSNLALTLGTLIAATLG